MGYANLLTRELFDTGVKGMKSASATIGRYAANAISTVKDIRYPIAAGALAALSLVYSGCSDNDVIKTPPIKTATVRLVDTATATQRPTISVPTATTQSSATPSPLAESVWPPRVTNQVSIDAHPIGLAYDSGRSRFYVADQKRDSILTFDKRFNPISESIRVTEEGYELIDLAVPETSSILYVATAGRNHVNAPVYRILSIDKNNLGLLQKQTWYSGNGNLVDLGIISDGKTESLYGLGTGDPYTPPGLWVSKPQEKPQFEYRMKITGGSQIAYVTFNPNTGRYYGAWRGRKEVVVQDSDRSKSIPINTEVGPIAANTLRNIIYISLVNERSMVIIDGTNDAAVRKINIVDVPKQLQFNPKLNHIYSLNQNNTFTIYDGDTGREITTFQLPLQGIGMDIYEDGNKIYLFGFASSVTNGFIVEISDGKP